MEAPNELPSHRIAGALRQQIVAGVLRPGDRVPSTRQIVREWGVAMATASRALAILRDEGLVSPRTGSGTVVRGDPRPRVASLTPGRIVSVAIHIAGSEGLDAVSMRRVAGVLRVAPMSLYRHVAGREELESLMVRAVFTRHPLPDPMPRGWRQRLEVVYRLQWRLYRTYPWLAELTLSTRPPLVPEAMLHSEWTLEALADLDLAPRVRVQVALALPALVHGLAMGVLREIRAEKETNLGNEQWWSTIDDDAVRLLRSGRFPRLSGVEDFGIDALGLPALDDAFEVALGHYLDGLALASGQAAVAEPEEGGPADRT
ncbi:GntR family transcriptional regulator [Georgenia deserti]|uniref:GntR family transcriptional regulator n=1 Tax=Georgenia deserti TaxID=2093781 RepID=A0ABW4L9P3_9MICO